MPGRRASRKAPHVLGVLGLVVAGDGDVDVLDKLRTPWLPPLSLSLPRPHLKECSLKAVESIAFQPCASPHHLELHIDGSGKDKGSWAVTVLWSLDNILWHFGGFMAGAVDIQASSDSFIGALKVDLGTRQPTPSGTQFCVEKI